MITIEIVGNGGKRMFEFDQQEIDWSPGQTPNVSGKTGGKPWRACFIGDKWHLQRISGDHLTRRDTRKILEKLYENTPKTYLERVKLRKTKIIRYTVYSGLTTALVALISWVIICRFRKKPRGG